MYIFQTKKYFYFIQFAKIYCKMIFFVVKCVTDTECKIQKGVDFLHITSFDDEALKKIMKRLVFF